MICDTDLRNESLQVATLSSVLVSQMINQGNRWMICCNTVLKACSKIKASVILILCGLSLTTNAAEPSINDKLAQLNSKADTTYVSFGFALNEFRSINFRLASSENGQTVSSKFPITAQTYATSITLGTYITDNFRTEIRYGTGIKDDTIEKAMDININYWFNWYIGPTYPVTDYANAYFFYGVSHYDADVTRREVKFFLQGNGTTLSRTIDAQPSTTEMEKDLFGTSFSTSWMLGLDFHLMDKWYLAFEYGRLLRDTDTNIKVYQAGTYLRYEF